MTYEELRNESLALRETRDCAVKAVAVVSGLSYRVVHDLFRQCGRKPRKGTPRYITEKVLMKLGLATTDVTKQFKAKTVCTLEREVQAGPRYLVLTRGHLLGVRHGRVYDWTAGRRHRIVRVWAVNATTGGFICSLKA